MAYSELFESGRRCRGAKEQITCYIDFRLSDDVFGVSIIERFWRPLVIVMSPVNWRRDIVGPALRNVLCVLWRLQMFHGA